MLKICYEFSPLSYHLPLKLNSGTATCLIIDFKFFLQVHQIVPCVSAKIWPFDLRESLSRKSLSTTAVMSRRFPSPKRKFSLSTDGCHGFNFLPHRTQPHWTLCVCTDHGRYHSNFSSAQTLRDWERVFIYPSLLNICYELSARLDITGSLPTRGSQKLTVQ